ncbi:MAG: phage terminase large subunit [Lentisphaeria bacterium]|nr:DNA-packaging protein [Lentisphaerota bacterium]MBR2626206.1 phage terminase large subunit [Lentisphaeria bacterium]
MFKYTPIQKEALTLLSSPAQHTMLFGGSRSGKSFVLCCALAARAVRTPGSRHAVIRRYCASARTSIGMDTMPKVLRSRFGKKLHWHFNKAENCFHFSNSSEIWLVGLDDGERADKILGKEFATIYFNECSELDYSSVQTALTRLAQKVPLLVNRAYYDCNPPGKSHWCYRVFIEKCDPVTREKFPCPENYAAMQMNPEGNRENLPPDYIENTLANLPERQRKRFLSGQWLDENEGALWNYAMIDPLRCREVPELERVVIGVDPAVTSGKNNDFTGIVAAGIDRNGQCYILADSSMQSTPLLWVREAIKLYRRFNADTLVVEVNNGGELLTTLFAREDDTVKVKAVRAFKDKFARAEPVAAFYEKKIVHHAGVFPELEGQMCSFKPGSPGTSSPDRMDALVWALTELTGKECGSTRFILA